MGTLVRLALRLRFIVVALAVVLVLAGPRLLANAPFDVFPEFAPPKVEIQTEAPGLSAEDVEALVTVPLENALRLIAMVTGGLTIDVAKDMVRVDIAKPKPAPRAPLPPDDVR